jgi:hypothetical protein
MKGLICILVIGLILMGFPAMSTDVHKSCTDKCYWDFELQDCCADGAGTFCLDMKYPVPYYSFSPCQCCNIITPGH